MSDITSTLEALSDSLKNEKVIYLDYPVHTNGGDMLIFLGVMAILDANDVDVVGTFSCHDYTVKRVLAVLDEYPSAVILLHGGGNFGDLYEHHQALRRSVFKNFSSEKIVLLPQSAHYQEECNLTADKELISKLSDAHFYARDLATFDLFTKFGVIATLCADTAHYLSECSFVQFKTDVGAEAQVLYFLRTDKEKANEEIDADTSKDWSDYFSFLDRKFIRLVVHCQRFGLFRPLVFDLWLWFTKKFIMSVASDFQRHNIIVTSRLHGHIFSQILGIKNVVYDNSYGKNTRYIECWTKDSDLILQKG